MPRPWFVIALVAVLAGAFLWERQARSAIEARVDARDASIVILRHTVTKDTAHYHAAVDRWHILTRVDTLPGRVDTLPIVREIRAAGDSVVQTCDTAVGSSLALTDSLTRQVTDLKRLVGGPWLRPALELTTGSRGLLPAVDLAAGHRLSIVARVEFPLQSQPVWQVGIRLGI